MAAANAHTPGATTNALTPVRTHHQTITVPRAPILYPRDAAARFIDHRPLIALTVALAIGAALGAAFRE
jgi:hypothetical protein